MILIIDNKSIHVPKIESILKELGIEFETLDKDMLIKKESALNYSGVILSGGAVKGGILNHPEKVSTEIFSIHNFEVPVLGICLGHQILGLTFHEELEKLPKRIRGKRKLIITKAKGILEGLDKEIDVFEGHTFEVEEAPEEFEALAHSADCDIEAMQHKTKPIYSVQFHPEASGEVGKTIIKNFLRICGELE